MQNKNLGRSIGSINSPDGFNLFFFNRPRFNQDNIYGFVRDNIYILKKNNEKSDNSCLYSLAGSYFSEKPSDLQYPFDFDDKGSLYIVSEVDSMPAWKKEDKKNVFLGFTKYSMQIKVFNNQKCACVINLGSYEHSLINEMFVINRMLILLLTPKKWNESDKMFIEEQPPELVFLDLDSTNLSFTSISLPDEPFSIDKSEEKLALLSSNGDISIFSIKQRTIALENKWNNANVKEKFPTYNKIMFRGSKNKLLLTNSHNDFLSVIPSDMNYEIRKIKNKKNESIIKISADSKEKFVLLKQNTENLSLPEIYEFEF